MAPLTPVLGDSPRVRILEALVRLGHIEFTRGELAREAELYRMTTNRMVPQLIEEGFVERVGGGTRPKFRVCTESPTLRVVASLEAALGLLEEKEPFDSQDVEEVVEDFRKSIVANQGLLDGAGPLAKGDRGARAKLRAKAVRKS
jgi:DNA-binding MarR family transcriptional regulator